MILLAVVAGVGDDALDLAATPGMQEQRPEVRLVAAAPGGGAGGEDQVAFGSDRQRKLGQAFDGA